MSDAYLERASEILGADLARLRALLGEIATRRTSAEADLRQVARALDEMTIRSAGSAAGPLVVRQAEQVRRRHADLSARVESLQRSGEAIEQLVRQIEMSSESLKGDGQAEADPWRAALMAQVIHGQEEERVRLAREVHDGPAQVMAHVLMGLEYALTLAHQDNGERLQAHLREMRDSSRIGLHEIRRFIADLRPPALEQRGLAAALQELAERIGATGALQARHEGSALPRLAADQELVLYRIAQEALNNAAKHAKGATVTLQWGARQGHVGVVVRDNGPGFDPRTVAARTKGVHWGLRSMRERAELIGAKLQISSAPGKGTAVAVTLPVKESVSG